MRGMKDFGTQIEWTVGGNGKIGLFAQWHWLHQDDVETLEGPAPRGRSVLGVVIIYRFLVPVYQRWRAMLRVWVIGHGLGSLRKMHEWMSLLTELSHNACPLQRT